MRRTVAGLGAGIALLAGVAAASAQTITHYDSEAGGFLDEQAAGQGLAGLLTVSAPRRITSFGVYMKLSRPGNIYFSIYDNSTGQLLYPSDANAFADTGPGYKFGDRIYFTFTPGTTYGLLAVADVPAQYRFDIDGDEVGVFSFKAINSGSRGRPDVPEYQRNTGPADIDTALVLAAPEPASWLMMILGFGVVGYAVRKRQWSSGGVRLKDA